MTNRQLAAKILLDAINKPKKKIKELLAEESFEWGLTVYETELVKQEIDNLLEEQMIDNYKEV